MKDKTNEELKAEAIAKAWIALLAKKYINSTELFIGLKVDENGWLAEKRFEELNLDKEGDDVEPGYYKYNGWGNSECIEYQFRTKSLSGIDTNNNWIRILPDGINLPKEDVDCFICFGDNTIRTDRFLGGTNNFNQNHYKYITHYQPIIKPLKPIF